MNLYPLYHVYMSPLNHWIVPLILEFNQTSIQVDNTKIEIKSQKSPSNKGKIS